MRSEVQVVIGYGPADWFREKLSGEDSESLLTLLLEQDSERRRIVVDHGDRDPEATDVQERPSLVTVTSAEYASLSEHVLINFAWSVETLNPVRLVLQNPPTSVRLQLERAFADVSVVEYKHPPFTLEHLQAVHDQFGEKLVGQAPVRERLLAALYPLTLTSRTSPVVIMFYGPSGVGKTETAHFINDVIEGVLLRRQFSMYHSTKFASYLFGGDHSEPALARDLLDREAGVVLIDEFDKADPMFFSAFYELFDGGSFEDKNYRVSVGPAIIICTSNYASADEVRTHLGDPLHSRFDAVIGFGKLSAEEVKQVIDRIVDERFNKPSDPNIAYLDQEDLRAKLHVLVGSSGNVRQLGKLVNEVIATMILDHVLVRRVETSGIDTALSTGPSPVTPTDR